MSKSETRCMTPECRQSIERYGDHYHAVIDLSPDRPRPKAMPDAVALCERCGGYTNGRDWVHQCKKCGATVEPGKLKGFFVPHRCDACDNQLVERERAAGKVCSRCRSVISYCCC